jgi:hypothetical protein
MTTTQPTFWTLTVKSIIAHTLTYFLVGLAAFTLLDYTAKFAEPTTAAYMRQTNDPIVALGPALQSIRGVLFAVVFYLLRECLFGRKRGWLTMWAMLALIGIFSTFGPAPGSVEGLIYTTIPASEQLSGGLLEVLTQSLLFAVLLTYWVDHPTKRWFSWILGVLFVLVLLMSVMGFFLA